MNNFKFLCTKIFESKFRTLPKQLLNDIKDTAKLYREKFQFSSDLDIKKKSNPIKKGSSIEWFYSSTKPKRYAPLCEFSFVNLETKKKKIVRVNIVFGPNTTKYAEYKDEIEVMTLFHENIKNFELKRLESLLVHEMTHGLQQYKLSSEEYENELEKMEKNKHYNFDVYSQEPIEVDSFLTEIGYRLKEEINELQKNIQKAKSPETKKVLEIRFEKTLLQLKLFIKSGIQTYTTFKELELPRILKDNEDFIVSISKNPKIWKRFKQKLTVLYNELTGEYP